MGDLVIGQDGTLDVASVATLSRQEIINWMRLRLHGEDHLVPSDFKQGEPSYHLLASIYTNLERDSRSYIRSTVGEFLHEMSRGAASWRGDAGHSLLLLAQDLKEADFLPPIKRMAEGSLFFDAAAAHDTDGIHRRLLQSLIALQWRGSPQFWYTQFERSPGVYAPIAFAGLNLISIRHAMQLLPRIPWDDPGTRRTMRTALRGLLPAYDHMLIASEFHRVVRDLTPHLRAIVEKMLPGATELRPSPLEVNRSVVETPSALAHAPGLLGLQKGSERATILGERLQALNLEESQKWAGHPSPHAPGESSASTARFPQAETEASSIWQSFRPTAKDQGSARPLEQAATSGAFS
jgi:hypothetical protein